ncbi:MAG: sugar transferase [Anaerolineae bacterium]
MSKRERVILIVSLVVLDALAILAALSSAYHLRIGSGWLPYHASADPHAYTQMFTMAVPIWIGVCAAMGLYNTQWLLGGPEEYARVAKASTAGIIVLVLVNFSMRDLELSRGLLVLAWGLAILFMVVVRFSFRRVIYWLRTRGLFNSRVLIVGVSQHTQNVARQLESTTHTGMRVLGFVDDYLPVGTTVMDTQKVLGTPADLKRLIHEHDVREIIIFPETLSWESFQETIREVSAGLNGTEIKLSPGFYEILTTEVKVSHKSLIPLFTLEGVRITDLDALLKIALDYTLGIALLIVLAPFMGMIALLIALIDGRPILERQEVLGLRGKRFGSLRFRTGLTGQLRRSFGQTLPDDLASLGASSRLGEFLFRTRLDKLPQLLDVLRGRMSLVGPRPVPAGTEERFGVWLSNLLTVKPGITGPWALGHLPTLEDEVRLDLYYIRYWTIWFDLQVLFQTAIYSLRYRSPAQGVAPRGWETGTDPAMAIMWRMGSLSGAKQPGFTPEYTEASSGKARAFRAVEAIKINNPAEPPRDRERLRPTHHSLRESGS